MLWLASLNECGCLGGVLCCEADEGVLWWVSLWGVGLAVGTWVFGLCWDCFVRRGGR